MRTRIVLLALLAAAAAGCQSVDCGEGTTERGGVCVPANETIGSAQCGPFTKLQGDKCVPMFPPTVCDPETTAPVPDDNGVLVCVSKGTSSCSAKLACAPPAAGKHTVCGQIYNFETGQPFAEAGATGQQCGTGATTGPCALSIRAYDAAAFAGGSTTPLVTGAVYIDDCGRYAVPDIPIPASTVLALGVDDTAAMGPGGVTNAVGVAKAGVAADMVTRDFEAFIVAGATLAGWAPNTANGPPFGASNGIYAAVFRGHHTGFDVVPNVMLTRNGATDGTRDYYFTNVANRTALDPAATSTTMNGSGLYNIDPTTQRLTDAYAGTGGLPAGCIWEPHGGASVGGVIYVQIFRPISAPGQTCTL
jgi:hypothetical protein